MKYWIARDLNGQLCLFNNKPELEYDTMEWIDGDADNCIEIDERLYRDIQFDDSPCEIEIDDIESLKS